MIHKSPHCLTCGLSLHPVIYFWKEAFSFEWCGSICLTWWKFMSVTPSSSPRAHESNTEDKEGRAVFAGRTEWTQLPGDRRYLCVRQRFSIKIWRVTEVRVGVQKEQQTKTQPSISRCPVGVWRTDLSYLFLQAANYIRMQMMDFFFFFPQTPAFISFSFFLKVFCWEKMAWSG